MKLARKDLVSKIISMFVKDSEAEANFRVTFVARQL